MISSIFTSKCNFPCVTLWFDNNFLYDVQHTVIFHMNSMVPFTLPLTYVADAGTNGVTWPSHGAPHFNCFDQGIQWHHFWCLHHMTLMHMQMESHVQKIMLHLILIILTSFKEFSGAIYNATDVCCWCWFQWCHMTKVMVYLISIVLTSGIQWHNLWWCLYHMTLMPMLMESHVQKSHFCTSFQSSWPKELNGTIYDKSKVMWYQCQFVSHGQKSHVYLILIVLTKGIQRYHLECHRHQHQC